MKRDIKIGVRLSMRVNRDTDEGISGVLSYIPMNEGEMYPETSWEKVSGYAFSRSKSMTRTVILTSMICTVLSVKSTLRSNVR